MPRLFVAGTVTGALTAANLSRVVTNRVYGAPGTALPIWPGFPGVPATFAAIPVPPALVSYNVNGSLLALALGDLPTPPPVRS